MSSLVAVQAPVSTSAAAIASPGRVIFIDLARLLAIVWMVYGHTINAVLAGEYRTGWWYDGWLFQRGLTAPLFLLVAGLAFSVAAKRSWMPGGRRGEALRRVRRFVALILIGYALHFPARRVGDLTWVTDEGWHSFLAVDVLQLVGVTFIGLQLLAWLTPSRRVFTHACGMLAVLCLLLTPLAWQVDWAGAGLPLTLAAYLSPATGSLFPLFPWAAYAFLGAVLGSVVSHYAQPWRVDRALAVAAIVLFGVGRLLEASVVSETGMLHAHWYPAASVIWRAGACLAVLAGLAGLSRVVHHIPSSFSVIARESPLIYVAHVVLVYGSAWSPGLYQVVGPNLSPAGAAAAVVLMLSAMLLLAWRWHNFRRWSPAGARAVLLLIVCAFLWHVV